MAHINRKQRRKTPQSPTPTPPFQRHTVGIRYSVIFWPDCVSPQTSSVCARSFLDHNITRTRYPLRAFVLAEQIFSLILQAAEDRLFMQDEHLLLLQEENEIGQDEAPSPKRITMKYIRTPFYIHFLQPFSKLNVRPALSPSPTP